MKETYIRCICERCGRVEEIPKTILTSLTPYPKSWGKVMHKHLCGQCYNEFKTIFDAFITNAKVKRVNG